MISNRLTTSSLPASVDTAATKADIIDAGIRENISVPFICRRHRNARVGRYDLCSRSVDGMGDAVGVAVTRRFVGFRHADDFLSRLQSYFGARIRGVPGGGHHQLHRRLVGSFEPEEDGRLTVAGIGFRYPAVIKVPYGPVVGFAGFFIHKIRIGFVHVVEEGEIDGSFVVMEPRCDVHRSRIIRSSVGIGFGIGDVRCRCSGDPGWQDELTADIGPCGGFHRCFVVDSVEVGRISDRTAVALTAVDVQRTEIEEYRCFERAADVGFS